jgi:hypothetical protein
LLLKHSQNEKKNAYFTAQIHKNIRHVIDAAFPKTPLGRIFLAKNGAYISQKRGVYLAKTNLQSAPPALPFITRRAGTRVATTHGRAGSCCGMPAADH